MSEISETIKSGGSDDNDFGAKQLNTPLDAFEPPHPQLLTGPSQVGFGHSGAEPCLPADVKRSLSTVQSDLIPPEIQKVIVEHIARNTHSHYPIKLRSFSGKIPRPNSKSYYNHTALICGASQERPHYV